MEVDEDLLKKLGVTLKVSARPPWPAPPTTRLEVALRPQVASPGKQVVSFGLPFGPDWLADDARVRVSDADGEEIPTYTEPLAHWWREGKQGSLRSVLVQFEMEFPANAPRRVTITWDRPRLRRREQMTPVADTQVAEHVAAPAERTEVSAYDYRLPRVMALLPADWLCASLIVWQQVPATRNRVAPWYDTHYLQHFPGSLASISGTSKDFSLHLFDRPATYVKHYARLGEEEQLLAALQAGDFYIQHLNAEGWFDVKPERDLKYVFTEGPALLYLLTGDPRCRAAVDRAVAAWKAWRVEYTGEGFWTERHHGFGMLAYLHAYEVTGKSDYLQTARRYFEAVYRLQTHPLHGGEPDGAWAHTRSSHGEGEETQWVTSPWMSAFLVDAIWKYWMLSGDARAPASLALYAKFIARHGLSPAGDSLCYLAASPGHGSSVVQGGAAHNLEGIYLLALGHYLSGGTDLAFLPRIQALLPSLLQDDANRPGRKFTWRFRETSMLIWFLSQVAGRAAPRQ